MREPQVRRIDAFEWRTLRTLRLQALRDAPRAFGSTFEREAAFPDERWQALAASGASGLNDVAVVADVDGAWVAMARGYLERRDEPDARPAAWLIAVYVDPRWRGHGLGRAVSGAVVDWARERGAGEVLLHVGDWNDLARRVYEHLGFEPTGVRTRLAHDASVTEFEMRLRL